MIIHLRSFQVITLIFIICGSLYAQEESKRLYGNIYFSATPTVTDNTIIMPYRDFKIEILNVPKNDVKEKKKKNQEVLFTTYPDSNGYFTFKDVSEGTYLLRISYFSVEKGEFFYKEIVSKKIKIENKGKEKQRLRPISIEVIIQPDPIEYGREKE